MSSFKASSLCSGPEPEAHPATRARTALYRFVLSVPVFPFPFLPSPPRPALVQPWSSSSSSLILPNFTFRTPSPPRPSSGALRPISGRVPCYIVVVSTIRVILLVAEPSPHRCGHTSGEQAAVDGRTVSDEKRVHMHPRPATLIQGPRSSRVVPRLSICALPQGHTRIILLPHLHLINLTFTLTLAYRSSF